LRSIYSAKFELNEPPLVLSLEPLYHRASDSFNHMGLRLGSPEAVKQAETRLKQAGLISDGAEDVECCYSRQTKFWLADPDRNLWEVYALTGEIPHRGSLASAPAQIADATIEQVRLRGTLTSRSASRPDGS
jgi:hypothetical protein